MAEGNSIVQDYGEKAIRASALAVAADIVSPGMVR